MNARFYLPYLNRFLSADTIVPDPTNPQVWNRYSYVANNPMILVDSSGYCWGFAIGMRNSAFGTTCNNIDTAWSIVTNPEASVSERLPAAAYLGVGTVSAGTVVVGSSVVTVGCLTGAGTMICAIGGLAATATSADGDPTNEVTAVAKGVSNTANAIMADGDPTNEIDRMNRALGMTTEQINELKHLNVYNQYYTEIYGL